MYAALPLDKESITKIKEAAPKERVRLVNEAIVSGWADEWMKLLEQKFEDEYGYNPTDVVRMPGFSPAKAAAQLREQQKSLRLTENTTLSQVWALTTHMVATMALDAYQVVPTVYKEIAQIEQSDSAEETYFPLQQTDTPQLVGENEPAPESRIAGVLTRIVNYRFARIIPISRKAIESDKTGRLKTRATGIGGRMGYAEERWWAVQLFAAYTSTYIRSNGGVIPGMCVAGQSATEPGYGGPTTFAGDVTLANLENLFEAAPYVTDLTGDYALVEPNVILAAASRKLALKKLLLSFFNPAVPGSAGSTGSYFSENALKGELDIYTSRFIAQCRAGLDSATPPWGVGEKGKVGLFQNNTPLEVTTENPLSGKSWEEQTMRMMCQRWFGAGVALPEFFLAGN